MFRKEAGAVFPLYIDSMTESDRFCEKIMQVFTVKNSLYMNTQKIVVQPIHNVQDAWMLQEHAVCLYMNICSRLLYHYND